MQLSDYAMIANSVPQNVPLESLGDLQQQKQNIESSALNNQAKGMQIKQAQDAISEKDAVKQAVMANTKYNPDGTSITDHRAVANQLGQSGLIDAAHNYTLDVQKQVYNTHKDQMDFLAHQAQGVMSQPTESRAQAFTQAIQAAKQANIDVTGHDTWDPQSTPNYLTGIIAANQDAKTYFEQPEKLLKAQADKTRADAYVTEQNSLADLHNSQKNKTDRQTVNLDTVQSPTISQATLDIMTDLGLSGALKDSPYQGLLTGAKNQANRNALAENLTKVQNDRGIDTSSLIESLRDYKNQALSENELSKRRAKVEPRVMEARTQLPIIEDLSKNIDRSTFLPLSQGENWWEKKTSDTNQAKLNAAITSFVTAYDGAMSGSTGTVAGKEHAYGMLNTAQNMDTIRSVLGVLDKEMQTAQDAPNKVLDMMRSDLQERRNKVLGKPINTDNSTHAPDVQSLLNQVRNSSLKASK